MSLPFRKYEGLGNDFVLVDLRGPLHPPSPERGISSMVLCDRRFGIGGDGVLSVLPPTSASADARMRVLNSDGSEAEMCGNGVRCVARYLHEHDPALRRSPLRIETLAGVMSCEIATSPSGQVESIAVDMGAPRLGRADVPMLPAATGDADRRCIAEPLRVGGAELRVTALSMGNPHAVCFVEAGADLARMAKTLGPALERHPDFPRRTNAGFARLRDQRTLDLVVWERACGLTLACGTGACAAVVAAVLEERIPAGGKVRVHLPGGWLDIMVSADLGRVMLRGPAFEVFAGEVDLRGLLLRRASGPHD